MPHHHRKPKLDTTTGSGVPVGSVGKIGHSTKMGLNRSSVPDESVKLRMTNLEYVWELDEFQRLRRLCEMTILPIDGVKVRSQSFGSKHSGFWFLELYPGKSADALRDQHAAESGNEGDGPVEDETDAHLNISTANSRAGSTAGIADGENCVVFLHLDTTKTTDAMAEFYFYVLNEEGKKIEGFKKGAKTFQLFRAEGDPPPCQGCSIPGPDLARFLRGGKLTIRVEMSVYRGLDFPTFGPTTATGSTGADGDDLSVLGDSSPLDAHLTGGVATGRQSSYSTSTHAQSERGLGGTHSPPRPQPQLIATQPYLFRQPPPRASYPPPGGPVMALTPPPFYPPLSSTYGTHLSSTMQHSGYVYHMPPHPAAYSYPPAVSPGATLATAYSMQHSVLGPQPQRGPQPQQLNNTNAGSRPALTMPPPTVNNLRSSSAKPATQSNPSAFRADGQGGDRLSASRTWSSQQGGPRGAGGGTPMQQPVAYMA